MLEQRRRFVQRKVVTALANLAPVGHVEQRITHVAPHALQRSTAFDHRIAEYSGTHQQHRRKQAPRSTRPKRSERKPIGSVDLGERECGN